MANIFIGLGLGIVAICILWLYGIAFTKGWQFALASILIPVTLVILIGDEQGQKAWGGVVLGVVLMVIGFFIPAVVAYPENVRQTSVVATQGVIYQNTQETHQDQVLKGLAYLQNYQGVWNVSTTINNPSDGGEQVIVKYVKFTSDGIKVFVDSVISNSNEGGPDKSCLLFHAENNNDYWVRPGQSDFQELNDVPGKKHFMGYAFYPRMCTNDTCPYSNIPSSNSFPVIPEKIETILKTLETTSSTIYFQYGCWTFWTPVKLFDFADFGNH